MIKIAVNGAIHSRVALFTHPYQSAGHLKKTVLDFFSFFFFFFLASPIAWHLSGGLWQCISIAHCSEPLSSVKAQDLGLELLFIFLQQKMITYNHSPYTKMSWTGAFPAIRWNYTPVLCLYIPLYSYQMRLPTHATTKSCIWPFFGQRQPRPWFKTTLMTESKVFQKL